MARTTNQIVRVLALADAMASSRRGISLPAFARRRGISQRTVYNDFKTIEQAGFPVIEVSRGRYRISETWRPLAQPHLDPDEALALFLARQLMGTLRVTSMGHALDRVWTKLSGAGNQLAMFPKAMPWLSVRSATGIDYSRHRQMISTFERSIREHRVVHCQYQRPNGDQTIRDLEPGELHWDPGLETLYLIAWCRLRQAVRVFAVHRFAAVDILKAAFTPRSETRSAAALQHAFRVWRSETLEPVTLTLRGRAAVEATERTWHPSQQVTVGKPGSKTVCVTFEVAEAAELIPWLMGLGPDVTIEEPTWLGTEVARRHRAAAQSVLARPSSTHSTGKRPKKQHRSTPKASN